MNARIELKIENAKHLYVIDTQIGDIDVRANTRAQAAKMARAAGYEVRSVNMEG